MAIELPDLKIEHVRITLEGTSPLIMHAWSHKAKQQMLDKQMKKGTAGKEAKDPEKDFQESIYRDGDGNYAFPSVAFKAAAVRAGTYADLKMTFLRGAFHVQGEMTRIFGDPEPREDMVRVGMGTADIRYRAQFPEWRAEPLVSVNVNAISIEQLTTLFHIAGFSVGIGDWRPEKDGQYGTFTVKEVAH
jgi:hypothetical protein